MKLVPTELPGVAIIETPVYRDHRGAFWEVHNQAKFKQMGLDIAFVQDSCSHSRKNTLRGLHFQEPNAQGKLIGVLQGKILDVAVDVRRNAPTFAKWIAIELTEADGRLVWIPPGFAHGFVALSEEVTFTYKVTQSYSPADEQAIRWDDPEIGIEWPIRDPILSPRDAAAPLLRDAPRLPTA